MIDVLVGPQPTGTPFNPMLPKRVNAAALPGGKVGSGPTPESNSVSASAIRRRVFQVFTFTINVVGWAEKPFVKFTAEKKVAVDGLFYWVKGTMFSSVCPGCWVWMPFQLKGKIQVSSRWEATMVTSELMVLGVLGWKAGLSQYV